MMIMIVRITFALVCKEEDNDENDDDHDDHDGDPDDDHHQHGQIVVLLLLHGRADGGPCLQPIAKIYQVTFSRLWPFPDTWVPMSITYRRFLSMQNPNLCGK